MTNISTTKITAGIAITTLLQRRKISGINSITHNQLALPGKNRAVACNTRWQYTIKHINAARHALNQTVRAAYAHQITRFMHRHQWHQIIQTIIHQWFGFAYAQTAYSITGKIQLNQFLSAATTQIIKQTTLHNTEKHLVFSGMAFLTTFRPTGRLFQSGQNLLLRRRVW